MSVTEICARIEPSTNSTSECTVDCGWTVTRTWLGHVEEPAGLDHFQALVEHGGGIDGDAAAHDPGGMLERLLGRDGGKLVERKLAERPARGGEPDGLDLAVRADAQALMHGVVLAVDGQDGHVALARGGGEDLAGGHHALLVGQADGLAGQDGGVRGFKAGHAHDGGDHEIGFGQRGAGDRAFGAVNDFDAGDAGLAQARGQLAGELFGGQRNERGRQRTACAKASSTLRPAASAATA
jgi:hypothetical protein